MTRRRVSELFSNEANAKAFAEGLPAGSEPTLIPLYNAEDKARGYSHPRFEGCKVAYWNEPMPFFPSMNRSNPTKGR